MKTSKEHSTQAAPKAGSQPAAPAQPTLAQQLGNAGLLRILQAKLAVGDPQDHFEQEADRVADQVMRMPDVAAGSAPAPASTQTTAVQRAADATSALPVVDAALEEAVAGLDGRGGPLSPEVRSFMEPRFGADLSAVRIHTDAHAHELARSVNARAFTVGRNVVFGAGHYAPQTDSGRRLLAHELTHTLQQGATTRLARRPRRASRSPIRRSNSSVRTRIRSRRSPTARRRIGVSGTGRAPRARARSSTAARSTSSTSSSPRHAMRSRHAGAHDREHRGRLRAATLEARLADGEAPGRNRGRAHRR